MPASEPDPVVVADARMRRASRRLTITSWLCLIPAVMLCSQAGVPSRDFLLSDPDMALAVTCLVAALAPLLATWGRVGRRRRIGLAMLGLLGMGLTVRLIGLDMDMVQRAMKLGVKTEGWWFDCIIPSGNYQARWTEFGRLALVLRIQAAVLEASMSPRRATRWRSLALVGVGLGLAAAAGASLIDWAVQDHVYTNLQSPLPAVMYLVAFAVFESCMRLGRLGRSVSTRPPSHPSSTVESRPRPRPRSGQRLSPDPAALAQGHRALVRARWWSLVAAGVGLIGLGRLLFAGLDLHGALPRHYGEASVWLECVAVVVGSALGLLSLRTPTRRSTQAVSTDAGPIELQRPGLRALVEMLERARTGLEHGHDAVFESLYGDLELQFENLDVREREWAKQRGLTRARLRSVLDQGADHDGELDADLRRALHRELSSMLASLRGLEHADPYRANLDTRNFIAQLGLDWIRADRAGLDTELRTSRRSVKLAVVAALAAAFALACLAAFFHPALRVTSCIPGIDGCRVDIPDEVLTRFYQVLVASLLFLPWAIGAAYRRMAARSFSASLPCEQPELAVLLPSPIHEYTCGRLTRIRRYALGLRTTLCVALLATLPLLGLFYAGRKHWLEHAIDDALILDMTLVSLAVLALVCARPVGFGLRRLYAKIWLAWLCADMPRDWSCGALLVELVHHRVELATALPLTEAHIEAIAKRIAEAPLLGEDVDSILAQLEGVRGRLHEVDRAWLLELEQQLVVCELLLAEGED